MPVDAVADPTFREVLSIVAENRRRADANPWVEYAGMFEDDPQFDEFLEAMKEYRQEVEAADES